MNEGDSKALELDLRDLRNAFGMFATGVTVVTTCTPEGRPIGLTCNSFASVSLKPPLVLWSLSLYSPNLQAFLQAPCFAVNILAHNQYEQTKEAGGCRRPRAHVVQMRRLRRHICTTECVLSRSS